MTSDLEIAALRVLLMPLRDKLRFSIRALNGKSTMRLIGPGVRIDLASWNWGHAKYVPSPTRRPSYYRHPFLCDKGTWEKMRRGCLTGVSAKVFQLFEEIRNHDT